MKKLLSISLLLSSFLLTAQTPCDSGMAGAYPCSVFTMQSTLSLGQLGATHGNDSWGWTDPVEGNEIAIVGLENSTFFIDITDPINPKRLGRIMSHNNVTNSWRDMKVYNDHVYIVSEASGHGMQMFDLTNLRDEYASPNANTTFTPSRYSGFGKAHNIIINEDSGYAYILGATGGGFAGGPIILNLSNPLAPVQEAYYSGLGYTHDAQVVTYDGPDPDYQGKEIYIGSNEDEVVILDVTNKSNIVEISTITYLNKKYTHQGWFTEDKKYFLLGDEQDELYTNVGNTKTIVLDFTDLDNPQHHFDYSGVTAAIDHNGYVRGNRFYQAAYSAGVRVMKVDDLENQNMNEIAYFDTYPSSNSAQFNGTWSVYPYFASGNIVVSGYNSGFFVIRDPNFDTTPPNVVCQDITATLDPITGTVTVDASAIDNNSTDYDDNGNNLTTSLIKSTEGITTFTCADVGNSFPITLTMEDDYGNKSSCIATVTIEASLTEYNGSAWSAGDPSIGSLAKFTGDFDSSDIGSDSVEACVCEVASTATVTISKDKFMKIERDVTVDGTLIIENDGSFVQLDDNASVTNNGTVTVNKDISGVGNRGFIIASSPLTSETKDAFGAPIQFRNHITGNFSPNQDVENNYPGASNFADNNGDNWSIYNGAMNPGEGYLVMPQTTGNIGAPADYNFSFTDTGVETLTNGQISFDILYNGTQNSSPNILGNPYASAIDADVFMTVNDEIEVIYFWEHLTTPSSAYNGHNPNNYSMGDMSMYSSTLGMGLPAANGGNTPNKYIASGQGFAIKAFSGNDAVFNNSMRVVDNNDTFNRSGEITDRLWLNVFNDTYQLGSTAAVAYSNITTDGFDQGADITRLATPVSLYSELTSGEQLGIQGRKVFDYNDAVAFSFSTQVEELITYKISIHDFNGLNLENAEIILIDNLDNTQTLLNESDYEFTSNAGTYTNRFTVIYKERNILGPDAEVMLKNIWIYPNPTQDVLNIVSPELIVESVEIYDIRGRKISNQEFEIQGKYHVDLSTLDTAMYFIEIITERGSTTKKIMKR